MRREMPEQRGKSAQPPSKPRLARRALLEATGAVGECRVLPGRVLGQADEAPPSERIRIGLISLGIRGQQVCQAFIASQILRLR